MLHLILIKYWYIIAATKKAAFIISFICKLLKNASYDANNYNYK